MRGASASIALIVLALMAISYGLFAPLPWGPAIALGGLAVAGLAGLSLWIRSRAARLPDGLERLRMEGRATLVLSPILLAFFLIGLGVSLHNLNQPWPGDDASRFQGRPVAMTLEPTGEENRKSLAILPETGGRWLTYDCHGEPTTRGSPRFRLACWSGSAMTTYPLGPTLPVVDVWSREGRILGLTANGKVLVDLDAERKAERETWWIGAILCSLVIAAILSAWIFGLRRLLRVRAGPKDIVT